MPDLTPAAAALQAAEQMLDADPTRNLAIVTDAHSYRGKTVLVAIARPGAGGVLQIPAADYDGMAVLAAAGIHLEPARPNRPATYNPRSAT